MFLVLTRVRFGSLTVSVDLAIGFITCQIPKQLLVTAARRHPQVICERVDHQFFLVRKGDLRKLKETLRKLQEKKLSSFRCPQTFSFPFVSVF